MSSPPLSSSSPLLAQLNALTHLKTRVKRISIAEEAWYTPSDLEHRCRGHLSCQEADAGAEIKADLGCALHKMLKEGSISG